jgi:hypothetical protein
MDPAKIAAILPALAALFAEEMRKGQGVLVQVFVRKPVGRITGLTLPAAVEFVLPTGERHAEVG